MGILSVKKITISFSIIFILLFSNPSIAISPEYLGNFCFQLDLTSPNAEEITPWNMKMGVTHTGDAYYLFQGTADIPTNEFPVIYTGTAVLIGNEIFVTLSGTHFQRFQREANSLQMRLDITSLNGSFWEIETRASPISNFTSINLISGDVTSIPCQ